MIQLTITQGGRIVIPAKIRKAMNLSVGDKLECNINDGELVMTTKRERIQKAKKTLQKYFNPDPDRSMVDEFIAERRAEQAKEDAEFNT